MLRRLASFMAALFRRLGTLLRGPGAPAATLPPTAAPTAAPNGVAGGAGSNGVLRDAAPVPTFYCFQLDPGEQIPNLGTLTEADFAERMAAQKGAQEDARAPGG